MAQRLNSFMGISSGTTITTGNSGGTSGTAFDAVTGSPSVNTSADLTTAYDRGMVAAVSAANASYVQWNITSSTSGYIRFYFRLPSNPPATLRLFRAVATNGSTILNDVRVDTANQIIFTNQAGSYIQRRQGLSNNTIYRCELDYTSGAPRMRLYEGDSTSQLTLDDFDITSALSEGIVQLRFGTMFSASQTYSPNLAAVGWSDTAWLGPAVSGPQTLTPASDITTTGWTAYGTGASFAARLADADDATYAENAGTGQVLLVALQSGTDPGFNGGHVFTVRCAAFNTASGSLIVRVRQGTTLIATRTLTGLTSTPTDRDVVLSEAEAANISDYTALRVEYEAAVS